MVILVTLLERNFNGLLSVVPRNWEVVVPAFPDNDQLCAWLSAVARKAATDSRIICFLICLDLGFILTSNISTLVIPSKANFFSE